MVHPYWAISGLALAGLAVWKVFRPKRIFISFAIENRNLRDLLVGQSKNAETPFKFSDHSVYTPWDSAWKTNCKERIKKCDGVIAIITQDTKKADGQIWEIKCALQENIPIKGIYVDTEGKPKSLPSEIKSLPLAKWKWRNVENFIENSCPRRNWKL